MNLRVPVCKSVGVQSKRVQAALDTQASPIRHYLLLLLAGLIEIT